MKYCTYEIVHNWYKVGHSTRQKRRSIRRLNENYKPPGVIKRFINRNNNNWKQEHASIKRAFEMENIDFHIDAIYQATGFDNLKVIFNKVRLIAELNTLFSVDYKIVSLINRKCQ